MSAAGSQTRQAFIPLKVIPVQQPWEGLLLPVSAFPIPAPELSRVRSFIQGLTSSLVKPQQLSLEVFIQFNQLCLGDGSTRFANHAREWKPKLGFGVWPDREPPALWNAADFENMPVGGRPRILTHKVFKVISTPQASLSAREVMLGLGAVVQVMTSDPDDVFLKKARVLLLPPIREAAFRSFPFYFPLFERKSLERATAAQLDAWSCGASAYIRESVEDAGILIASREPLGPALQTLGGRLEQGPDLEWRLPS